MGEIDIDQLLKILPRLIRENDTVKGAILTALSGVVATREDIKDLIKEMHERFEKVDERFEKVDKRFEKVDERFQAYWEELKKLRADMNAGFKQVDKRLDDIAIGAAERFEVFCKDVIKRIGDAEGKPVLFLEQRRHFTDKEYKVSAHTTDVEIDIFSPEPLIIAEVTYKVKTTEKLHTFTRKINFLETEVFGKSAAHRYFCTLEVPEELRQEINAITKKHGIELITEESKI